MNSQSNMKTFLYCDGAHIQGTVQSGYGLVVKQGNKELYSEYGKLQCESSMRAELIAVLHAVKYIIDNPGEDYVVVSDCKEVVECMVGNSMRKKEKELWSKIEVLSRGLSYHVAHINKKILPESSEHVKANKKADALAYKGATEIAKEYYIH